MNETDDFLAREESVSFSDGVTTASVQFYVKADSFAEGNETYLVRIREILGGGEISSPSTMMLIITANDEPFGVVTFQESSRNLQVSEPIGETPSSVELQLQRQPGIFGTVMVNWEVRVMVIGGSMIVQMVQIYVHSHTSLTCSGTLSAQNSLRGHCEVSCPQTSPEQCRNPSCPAIWKL